MPAGDASSSLPPQDPAMGGEPMPDAGVPEPGGGMPPMDNAPEATGKAKEISDIASEISEKDQETLLAYARSLKDTSEEAAQGSMPGGDMPLQDPAMAGGQPPMMESVVFTKGQLRTINENFGEMSKELERSEEPRKTTKTVDKKNKGVSPFDPPKKNIK